MKLLRRGVVQLHNSTTASHHNHQTKNVPLFVKRGTFRLFFSSRNSGGQEGKSRRSLSPFHTQQPYSNRPTIPKPSQTKKDLAHNDATHVHTHIQTQTQGKVRCVCVYARVAATSLSIYRRAYSKLVFLFLF